eukprot:TRINITY_DN1494_c0_g1_i1.p1 TRINITY_DN1494_c0_g1~~TRINITY_DN1494_c0_g1_i1.p1  ORF type:complete len:202 (-),score=17.98 TRINITY_DN1494_c0_g1_i1:129-734(-)
MRYGYYKMLVSCVTTDGYSGTVELYNLNNDEGEEYNLAYYKYSTYKKVIYKMISEMMDWAQYDGENDNDGISGLDNFSGSGSCLSPWYDCEDDGSGYISCSSTSTDVSSCGASLSAMKSKVKLVNRRPPSTKSKSASTGETPANEEAPSSLLYGSGGKTEHGRDCDDDRGIWECHWRRGLLLLPLQKLEADGCTQSVGGAG